MYRILTEDKNRRLVKLLLYRWRDKIHGYTMSFAEGAWNGEEEQAMTIDFIGVPFEIVKRLAEVIKHINGQQEVWVLDIPATVTKV